MTSILAMTGASGGLGASTLVAALGDGLPAKLGRTVLVDLDLDGGGLDVTCGVEHERGLRWRDLARVRGPVPASRLLGSLPGPRDRRVLSAGTSGEGPGGGPPGPAGVLDVVASLVGAVDLLVADQPRWALDALPGPPTVWALLTGTSTRELADLDALVERIERDLGADHLSAVCVVTCGAPPDAALCEAIADHLGVPQLGHVGRSSTVRSAAERGAWPSGRVFSGVTRAVADRLWRRTAA